ncbi:polysaccharide biosynthesis tyrosine autokinase [Rhodopseudomonas palustris]|uniref:polysaccharide biosynthesis tyrosine autokinase n=1 Tax=Rhodopseudomonas palustris TaxID=1076 RepID=UPI000641EF5F|nr:polysaccharide biosynthesis tyrosine autokinase [Rhodopseudomonas palustris]
MNFAGQPLQDGSLPRIGTGKDALSLLDVSDFVARHWRFIGLVTVFVIALALAYLAVAPSRYTAQTDMIIDTKRVTWTQSEFATENRMVEDASVESEIETTKSEKVALQVIRKLRLTEDPEFIGSGTGLRNRLYELLNLDPPISPQVTPSQLEARALSRVKDNLKVIRLGRSYIEQISFTSLVPEKAATIANAFADAYIEDQIQAKFEATRRASEWLQQRIGELRQQASDAYRAVQDFKSTNSIIVNGDGKLASDLELDQLGISLAKARAETSQARAKLERITRVLELRQQKGSTEIPDPVVTDALSNPVITRLRQQYLDNQSKEAEWSSRYGPDHQAARNLRSEMANVRQAIWDEVSRIAESYQSEVQIAKTQEESIDKRMIEVFQSSTGTRQAQVHLKELETAATTYRGIYETFLTRFTQSVQQQSFPSTEARVVTLASPPLVRSSPKTNLTLALAAVSGLALGILAAFARDRMSRRIHTRAQLETILGTSCLAIIPSFEDPALASQTATGSSRLSRMARHLVRKRDPASGQPRAKSSANSAAFEKINDVAPFSATAEALRHIKVAIDLSPGGGRVIGIVSARPGEGKTTICASFAAFLSKSGARTLLIDGDLRNPSLSRTLGYKNKRGLLELVADQLQLSDLVVTDPVYKFDFLPSATEMKPINSADVLTSPSVKRMLKSAAGNYEYIIVDLPPILPVVDVKAAAHLFDAFILVVEWGATMSDEVRSAVGVSRSLSERLLGAVLNKTDEDVMRRLEGYSYRSHNYYYYGAPKHENDQTAS